MNQSEFDKLINILESVACRGNHVYAMALFEAFPFKWSAFIKSFDYATQQYIEDSSLNVDLCHN